MNNHRHENHHPAIFVRARVSAGVFNHAGHTRIGDSFHMAAIAVRH